ncbi:Pentapeptide repeats (8 copies) [Pseudovibrio sp. W64]|uniref:pentapeptide repeat-containing protein n=1 Tax=Pseudovibrio sp. W64 TaxID=1735583 RepID=UPI0007AEC823|nr:pentapeptide repeat-containing protein [Pseudovibrio sp. W64]KZK77953.1 Pentapeptide repeats (8 copies) [Pseudovibrio sp. W64]
MKNEKPTFWDWVHLNRDVDFTRARWLGSFIGALLFIAALAIVLICLIGLWHLLSAFLGYGPFGEDATGSAIRNIGLIIAAAFSAPFLVWRSIVAQKNADTAVQSQITDRINKAVEGLGAEKIVKKTIETPEYQKKDGKWMLDKDGNPKPALRPDGTPIIDREVYESSVPNLEVRIGAIYALERIAQDSLRDHLQIMEILCAYIRENAPVVNLDPTELPLSEVTPRVDIQAAINVIGRRSSEQLRMEQENKFRLNLSATDLSGVDFRSGNFTAALFVKSRLEFANFQDCELNGTYLSGALLNFAIFRGAILKGTRCDRVIFNRPTVPSGSMYPVSLANGFFLLAKVYGVSFRGADLSAAEFLSDPKDTNVTFGSKDTQLHPRFNEEIGTHFHTIYKINKMKKEGNEDEAMRMQNELYAEHEFVDWVPFDQYDGAVGEIYKKFLDRLGLTQWPYQE